MFPGARLPSIVGANRTSRSRLQIALGVTLTAPVACCVYPRGPNCPEARLCLSSRRSQRALDHSFITLAAGPCFHSFYSQQPTSTKCARAVRMASTSHRSWYTVFRDWSGPGLDSPAPAGFFRLTGRTAAPDHDVVATRDNVACVQACVRLSMSVELFVVIVGRGNLNLNSAQGGQTGQSNAGHGQTCTSRPSQAKPLLVFASGDRVVDSFHRYHGRL